ncbi:MAG: hypothetical protein FJ218_06250, partial [Ignavibacteria bacterium]|nr:hypothetical protein [Ignavibacteria bacterium]
MKQQKVFCYIHSFVLIILINLNSCADKNPETLTSQFFGESEFDLSILQPHGGESFPKGGTCLIQWQNKKKFDNVDIELYKGDENLGNIVSAASDVGEFIWEISTSIDVSNNYKIKIIGSSSNSRVFIFSKTFSIYEPPLTI